MTGVKAVSTQWYKPIFDNVKFIDLDLRAAQLSNTKIVGAVLDGEKTSTVIFNEIIFENLKIEGKIERLIANDCSFDGMNAAGLFWERCIFTNCSMKRMDLGKGILKEVTLVSTDLTSSNLDGVVINKALFQEIDLSKRDLSGIRIFGDWVQAIGNKLL